MVTRLGARGGDDDSPVFGVQLDIACEAGLLKERFRDSNTLRIADGDNSGFDPRGARHRCLQCTYLA